MRPVSLGEVLNIWSIGTPRPSFSLFIKLYFVYKVQGPSDQFFIFVVKDQGHDHLHHGDRDRGHGEVG